MILYNIVESVARYSSDCIMFHKSVKVVTLADVTIHAKNICHAILLHNVMTEVSKNSLLLLIKVWHTYKDELYHCMNRQYDLLFRPPAGKKRKAEPEGQTAKKPKTEPSVTVTPSSR